MVKHIYCQFFAMVDWGELSRDNVIGIYKEYMYIYISKYKMVGVLPIQIVRGFSLTKGQCSKR